MSRSWYILNVYTGYEGKVERTIKSLLEKQEIDSNVMLDVKVPMEEVVEIKDGKKKSRLNKFLPGYIMLEMDLPELGWKDTCAKLYRIQGVTGFVGPGSKPIPLTEAEMRPLGIKQEDIVVDFEVGDVINVIGGPWKDTVGKITEMNPAKQTVTINVELFDRETPVEISFGDVEKLK